MIKCDAAVAMIEGGRAGDDLQNHLESCSSCRARQALWDLLGEARVIAPSREFTHRLLEAVRGAHARAAARPRLGSERSIGLEDFADFPPGSLGRLLFGKLP